MHSLQNLTGVFLEAPRNGDETFNTLLYGAGIALLLNAPKQQPAVPLEKLLLSAKREHDKTSAIVAKGVRGKYQALRLAEVRQWEQAIHVLQALKR
jgi:hypothetical protein